MTALRRSSVIKWIVVLLALIPTILFAYLGQYSRLLADDFTNLSIGLELGPWESALYWRAVHNGSYSYYFLHGLVAPLDTLLPSVAPSAIITVWLLGLAWLITQLLSYLPVNRERRLIAVSLAALVVAAAINALYVPHAFYWYSASARYPWPLALLLVYFAATFKAATSIRPGRALYLSALAGGVYCFVVGGFAELHSLFQLTLFTLVFAVPFAVIDRARRRPYIILLGTGLAASCASLVVQLSAPGVHRRLEENLAGQIWTPIRSLPGLIDGTLRLTFEHVGHQEAFAGFMLLLAAGLAITLHVYRPAPECSRANPIAILVSPLWLGLISQLCFIPILWTHISDDPQVFGQFSVAFFTVVCINSALTVTFLILIGRRRQLDNMLKRRSNGWLIYSGFMIACIVLLFALTQIRSIDYAAATFLFVSALVLLLVLCWQLSSGVADLSVRRLGLIAILWMPLTIIVIAALAFASLYTQGGVQPRIMSGVAFLQVIGGLLWGSVLGMLIMQSCSPSVDSRIWIAWFRKIGFGAAIVIGLGVVNGQARSIPNLAAFAAEWDARHELMLSYRREGRTDVTVPLLMYDITEHFCCTNISSSQNANYYYGFRSLDLSNEAD